MTQAEQHRLSADEKSHAHVSRRSVLVSPPERIRLQWCRTICRVVGLTGSAQLKVGAASLAGSLKLTEVCNFRGRRSVYWKHLETTELL